jgi:dynein intermediate chain 1, axonemal
LTFNNPSRSVETQTVPPPRSQFGANVVQWHIYDSYNEDYARQKLEKEKEMLKDKKPGLQKHAEMKRGDAKTKVTEEFNRKYLQMVSWVSPKLTIVLQALTVEIDLIE